MNTFATKSALSAKSALSLKFTQPADPVRATAHVAEELSMTRQSFSRRTEEATQGCAQARQCTWQKFLLAELRVLEAMLAQLHRRQGLSAKQAERAQTLPARLAKVLALGTRLAFAETPCPRAHARCRARFRRDCDACVNDLLNLFES